MSRAPYAVLFDLDGTLVDSIELLVASMEYAFEGRTRRPSVPEWLALIGTPLDRMLARWADDVEEVDLLRARYREHQLLHHDSMLKLYPGMVETVRSLHADGHALAVVTSKLEVGARRALKFAQIEECFAAVVGIDQTTRHKPDPEPVQYALAQLQVPAERALFVGDSTHDMQAGRAAGVRTGAVLWGPYTRAELEPTAPDYWFERAEELPPLVARLARG
ncbi:MAG: HAD-IA family hydrolase [Gemmatimonadaceae bacterium]|nr:HAD-IA family hydrolase [Gemmatimonadaceae bacterium]MCW5826538.1 HAD-IA family hydrolase [Gemmatimonadaceae bacterium]